MAYDKQTWDTTSYVNPTRMNYMENGIESAASTADSANSTANSASSGVNAINTKIGNTSISGIGDGTVTGAISAVNVNLTNIFNTPDMGAFDFNTQGLTALANKILQNLGSYKVFFCTCLLNDYDFPLIVATRRSNYIKILIYTYDYIIILNSADGTNWTKSRTAYTPF